MVNISNYLNKNKLIIPIFFTLVIVLLMIITGHFLYREGEIIADYRQKLTFLNQDLVLLDKILSDQKTYQEKISIVKKTLPATFEDVTVAVTQIEKLASINNQKIEIKIADQTVKEANNLLSLKLSLKTTGSYGGYSMMLTGLSRLPYHTQIDSIKMEQVNKELSILTDLRLYIGVKE